MPLNIESLSNIAKAELLARIAHRLTVVARDAYEVGTANVLEPQVLRACNELLHRVTGAVSDHLFGRVGYSMQSILEMMEHLYDNRISRFHPRVVRMERVYYFCLIDTCAPASGSGLISGCLGTSG
jgi:hypothetical protein